MFCYNQNIMRKIILILIVCFFIGASDVSAAQLMQVGHLELLGVYSDIKNGDHDTGEEFAGFWAPAIKMSDTLAIIPLLDVHLNRVAQYLPQEEGNLFFNTYFTANLSVAARKEFLPGWFLKVSTLGTWVFMKETQEENWGKGLYDYNDAGIALEIRQQFKTEDSETNLSGGFEVYQRKYPNFQTLISDTSVTPPEVDEKDYDGFKYRMRFEHFNAQGIRLYAEPYYLDKFYVDKHLVNDDGTLDLSKNRKDYEVSLDFGASAVTPFWERVTVAIDNNLTHERSNIGYYDSRTTLSLSDDVFTNDYYAYDSGTVNPSIEYAHPLGNEKILRTKIGFSYLYRRYTDRKAQLGDGTYTAKDEHDETREYFLTLTIPLTKSLNWLTKYSYDKTFSNMEYETFYRYNYESQQVTSGITFDF